jgi:hypothetical protein
MESYDVTGNLFQAIAGGDGGWAAAVAASGQGRAVQVDSINTRVESVYGFSGRNWNVINCFQRWLSISTCAVTQRRWRWCSGRWTTATAGRRVGREPSPHKAREDRQFHHRVEREAHTEDKAAPAATAERRAGREPSLRREQGREKLPQVEMDTEREKDTD